MELKRDKTVLTAEQKEWQKNLHRIWWSKKKELGLTQGSIGELTGLGSQAAIGKYINGDNALNVNAVLQFASALEVAVDEIAPNSEITRMLTNAKRAKEDKDPAVALESFQELYKLLSDQSKIEALTRLAMDIDGDGKAALLKIIAETLGTSKAE